ncbi:MAG: hypothetical protein PGN13_04200 [Patulibacter minatonensis]
MRRLLLGIASAAVLAVGGPSGTAPAAEANFYEPPSPLPTTQPGALLRAEPLTFRGSAKPADGTVGYRIMYVSTSAMGAPVAVSGTLLLPDDSKVARPLVGFAPGSHGMGDQCAPSRQLSGGSEQEMGTLRRLLADGNAVVMTDYEGLGTPGTHPFAVNVAAGRDVLDSIRAARQVQGTGLQPDGRIGLFGYSQGGGAVGSAAEQAPSYAPELKPVGAVVGGVLGEPARLPQNLFGNFWAGVVLFAVIGYDSAYPELQLKPELSQFGRNALSTTGKSCIVQAGIPLQYAHMNWFTKRFGNPIASAKWKKRMLENTLGYGKPAIPIYQYHGEWDQVLNYNSALRVRSRWCQQGVDVTFTKIMFAEHFLAQPWALDGAAKWMQARLAGEPAPRGNCPAV